MNTDHCEIIIPSYDRSQRLLQTLWELRRLYPDVRIRLAIQGERPERDLRLFIGSDPRITVSFRAVPGVVDAINSAVDESDADVLLILDDDAVPCAGWVESHVSALLSSPAIAYTCGREVNVNNGRSALSEIIRIGSEMSLGFFVPKSCRIGGRIIGWTTQHGMIFCNFFLPGRAVINAPMEGNFAIRRADFLRMNGFDRRFVGNAWGYGPELGYRFARDGRYGLYVGEAIILHYPHPIGGTRVTRGRKWLNDYAYNNRIVIRTIGPMAWFGALPRLARRGFRAMRS
jgi:GT2 family glycosyltransferase